MLQELIKQMIKGDMSVFSKFYEETKRSIFYNIFAIVKDEVIAEDVLQETYIKFLEKLKTLDKQKNILGYLFVISKNIALDYLKKHKNEVSFDKFDNLEEHASYQKLEDEEVFVKMKKFLSDKEYEIVILHVINEMTHQEISHLKKWPLGSVTWSYQNAIKKLQKGW